ncbi:uncharacterized, partial [Tachysurus ichikawai]
VDEAKKMESERKDQRRKRRRRKRGGEERSSMKHSPDSHQQFLHTLHSSFVSGRERRHGRVSRNLTSPPPSHSKSLLEQGGETQRRRPF